MAWVGRQSATIALRFDALHLGPALANCAAFAGFQAFALAATALVAYERRAGGAAAEHSRTIERLRVARDLHDALGHHLTALGIRLEVAAHLADGRAKEHVERAHAIGRLLLADVRNAVVTCAIRAHSAGRCVASSPHRARLSCTSISPPSSTCSPAIRPTRSSVACKR